MNSCRLEGGCLRYFSARALSSRRGGLLNVSGFGGIQALHRLGQVGGAVFIQFGLADVEMRPHGWMRAVRKLAAQPQRADVRPILIARPVGYKSFVRNGQGEVPRRPRLQHVETV